MFSQDFETPISIPLTQPLSVAELLGDDSFPLAFKSQIYKFFGFFSDEENITELLNWSLSDMYVNDSRFSHLTDAATQTLSFRNAQFQRFVFNSRKFQKTMKRFFSTSVGSDPFYIAHFEKIFIQYLNFTRGECLVKIPNLREQLIKRLDILPARELFLHIVFKYDESLYEPFCNYRALAMLIDDGEVLAQSALSTLTELLKYSKFVPFSEDRFDFVESLIKYAINASQPDVSRIQAFHLAANVRDSLLHADSNSQKDYELIDLENLLQEYGYIYKKQLAAFQDSVIVKSAAFLVFDNLLGEALQLFKQQPQNTFLAQAVVSGIRRLDDASLAEFVENNSLLEMILESEKQEKKTVGQITEIALHLYHRHISNDEKWLEFVGTHVVPKVHLMVNSYGGQRP